MIFKGINALDIGLRKLLIVVLIISGTILSAYSAETSVKNRKPNKLFGVESPYLQQHVYNVVDWYPWGNEALDKAKREGKPIFLSVGYSTCHWCHVMRRESFENEVIGKYMNENFVSIKIDRERRPDLDEQFMLVTQIIAGSGGWPNSVFLTPEGKPFFAGTYFPPDVFMKILEQLNGLWNEEPDDVRVEGERIASLVRDFMNRSEAAKDLTPEAVRAAARAMLPQMDEFNGGFGVAPKFPQESTLLFLLDQAERDGDRELFDGVMQALDGMIKGGIHDHVGGGFHRYSVDAEWDVPHFEKMLYNQAMIGRLLVRAYAATGRQRYKRAAQRAFDYVLREMRDEKGGFYSAQDAVSRGESGEDEEGYYYIWTPEQVEAVLGNETAFALKALSVVPDGNFEQSNVLRMSDLPEILAEEYEISEADYLAWVDDILAKLYKARSKRPPPHKDRKIVVAWNAMMIETLAEASSVFGRPDYYQAAKQAADYILREFLQEDGLKRVEFEGSIGVEGQLPDYAGLGTALLALHDYQPMGAGNANYLKIAQQLVDEIGRRFGNEDVKGGAFRMTMESDGLGQMLPVEDNEIPSGNALALSLLGGLSKRVNDPKFAQDATLLAAALSGAALESAAGGGYALLSAQRLILGESGHVRFMADGAVRVTSRIEHKEGKVKFDVRLKKGWHINANKPLEDYFIPTQLSVDGKKAGENVYPRPTVKSLQFNAKPMALYEGEITLVGEIGEKEAGETGEVLLQLQACSDQICLLPEEVIVRIW